MRVTIDEIKEGGLDRAWELTQAELDAAVRTDRGGYRAKSPVRVEAHLDRVSRRVLLRARCRAELGAPCSRCLAPVAVELPVEFALTLLPEAEDRSERPAGANHAKGRMAGSFRAEEADEERYAGREIDLDPIVREQILLALPGYPVCREGCRGLCPVCGRDRNEGDCGCDPHVPDPRWAALEKLRGRAKKP